MKIKRIPELGDRVRLRWRYEKTYDFSAMNMGGSATRGWTQVGFNDAEYGVLVGRRTLYSGKVVPGDSESPAYLKVEATHPAYLVATSLHKKPFYVPVETVEFIDAEPRF
jgi:hypothetical protein